jgi:hypothetical protein
MITAGSVGNKVRVIVGPTDEQVKAGIRTIIHLLTPGQAKDLINQLTKADREAATWKSRDQKLIELDKQIFELNKQRALLEGTAA